MLLHIHVSINIKIKKNKFYSRGFTKAHPFRKKLAQARSFEASRGREEKKRRRIGSIFRASVARGGDQLASFFMFFEPALARAS